MKILIFFFGVIALSTVPFFVSYLAGGYHHNMWYFTTVANYPLSMCVLLFIVLFLQFYFVVDYYPDYLSWVSFSSAMIIIVS